MLANVYKLLYATAVTDQTNPYGVWERNFVQQMLRLREARQMTQTDLARYLRAYGLPFHQQTVQRIEAGERPVRLNEAHLIARALEVELDSMTATGTPSAREMRYAVDRLRRSSGMTAGALIEAMAEWLADVESFALVLSDRGLLAVPSVDQTEELDSIARWGLAWATKLIWAHDAVVGAWSDLTQIEGDSNQPTIEDEEFELPVKNDVINSLRRWVEKFGDSNVAELSVTDANMLYSLLPEEADEATVNDTPSPVSATIETTNPVPILEVPSEDVLEACAGITAESASEKVNLQKIQRVYDYLLGSGPPVIGSADIRYRDYIPSHVMYSDRQGRLKKNDLHDFEEHVTKCPSCFGMSYVGRMLRYVVSSNLGERQILERDKLLAEVIRLMHQGSHLTSIAQYVGMTRQYIYGTLANLIGVVPKES